MHVVDSTGELVESFYLHLPITYVLMVGVLMILQAPASVDIGHELGVENWRPTRYDGR